MQMGSVVVESLCWWEEAGLRSKEDIGSHPQWVGESESVCARDTTTSAVASPSLIDKALTPITMMCITIIQNIHSS